MRHNSKGVLLNRFDHDLPYKQGTTDLLELHFPSLGVDLTNSQLSFSFVSQWRCDPIQGQKFMPLPILVNGRKGVLMVKELKTHSDKKVLEVPTQEGYDRWSESYDTNENPLILLEESILYTNLGDVRGRRFLDLGCGTGRHSLKLASLGAEVIGIDFSEGMLAIAQRKTVSKRVQFIKHDLAQSLPFPDGSFDSVLCALVLDHVERATGQFYRPREWHRNPT